MGLFGKSNNEKIIDQVYVLIANASEKMIQADGIKNYRDKMLKRAEWLDGETLDLTADALVKYAISLTSYSKFLLSQSSSIKGRPFINMALQPEEEIIVSSVFPDDTRSIIMRVRKYGDNNGLPCPAEVLKWIVLDE